MCFADWKLTIGGDAVVLVHGHEMLAAVPLLRNDENPNQAHDVLVAQESHGASAC